MAKLIWEVLEEVRKKKSKKEKVEVLKQYESWPLKDIIRGSMDSTVEWNLPPGEPPYTPCEPHNAPANLMRENKKFGYFIKGGPGDKLPGFKRENIFLGIVEGVDPNDAKLVVDMINKKTPEGLSRPIVNDAFPGLLKD
jgi:hypothetical protein